MMASLAPSSPASSDHSSPLLHCQLLFHLKFRRPALPATPNKVLYGLLSYDSTQDKNVCEVLVQGSVVLTRGDSVWSHSARKVSKQSKAAFKNSSIMHLNAGERMKAKCNQPLNMVLYVQEK